MLRTNGADQGFIDNGKLAGQAKRLAPMRRSRRIVSTVGIVGGRWTVDDG